MDLDKDEQRLLRGAGWGVWAMSWVGLVGLGVLLTLASVIIGSDEALAARPYFMAALVCMLSAGLVFAAGVGHALSTWMRAR